MKKIILFAFGVVMLASCGTSPKSGDINVLGRWYAYTDDSRTEVDSTAYFDFFKNQNYLRRYHDAGSLEAGTYACNNNTKEDYGNKPSKRVSVVNGAGEEYYIDIVQDGEVYMFVTTYRMNDKTDIVYYTKHSEPIE